MSLCYIASYFTDSAILLKIIVNIYSKVLATVYNYGGTNYVSYISA